MAATAATADRGPSSSSPMRSPRRPLSLAEKSDRITNKVTGVERHINVTESNRIAFNNQLRRSCIESSNVPIYTSFNKDSAAYNLTVNFNLQSSRKEDDPKFRMYKAMIRHPDAFVLPERERHRMQLLQEIDNLATLRNVEVSFDDALPRISPRQTRMNNSPPTSPSRSRKPSAPNSPMRSGRGGGGGQTSAPPTPLASILKPSKQREEDTANGEGGGGGEAFDVAPFIVASGGDDDGDHSPNATMGSSRGAQIVTPLHNNNTNNHHHHHQQRPPHLSYNALNGTFDRIPDILTPRAAHPRTRIEEQIRSREAIINEIINSNNNANANTLRGEGAVVDHNLVKLGGGGGKHHNLNNLSGGGGRAGSMASNTTTTSTSTRQNNNNNNSAPAAPPTAATVLPPPPSNAGRRQSVAVPLIVGGSERITDAAKAMARRKAKEALQLAKNGNNKNRHSSNNDGKGKRTLKKAGGGNTTGGAPLHLKKKGRGGLVDDEVVSNPSETYDEIPDADLVDDASSSYSGGSSFSDDDDSDDGGKKKPKKLTGAQSLLAVNRMNNSNGSGNDSSSSNNNTNNMLLNDAPVAVVIRSFHLSSKKGHNGNGNAPQPPSTSMKGGHLGRPVVLDGTVTSPRSSNAKSNSNGSRRRSSQHNNAKRASIFGAGEEDDDDDGTEEGRPLSRDDGQLGSGFNIAIPIPSVVAGAAAPTVPAAPMPAPQRGVGGASMLTVRDQIVRATQNAVANGDHNAPATGSFSSAPLSRTNTQLYLNNNALGGNNNGTSTLTTNWCLVQPKQESSREHTNAAVTSALNTPRAVRDLFAGAGVLDPNGNGTSGGGANNNGGTPNSGGNSNLNSAMRATSFFQSNANFQSFANMKRGQPSFAGFGGANVLRKSSTILGFTSTYNTFGSTGRGGTSSNFYRDDDDISNLDYLGETSNGLGGGPAVDAALTHVIPPVIFRGLTSSGAGAPQVRRKRTMNVAYGVTTATTTTTSGNNGNDSEGEQRNIGQKNAIPAPPTLNGSAFTTLSSSSTGVNGRRDTASGNRNNTAFPPPNNTAAPSSSALQQQQRQMPRSARSARSNSLSVISSTSRNGITMMLPPKPPLEGRGRLADGSLSARI